MYYNKANINTTIMKRILLLMMLLNAGFYLATAQTISVKGIVVSEDDGAPIAGASVLVKGTNQGTITNVEGEFSMSVPATAETLVISYIGMKRAEVPVKTNMKIELKNDTEIDEVVVVAYGSQKKRNLTASISSVKSDDLMKTPATTLEQAMKGKMTGVQITQSTGTPGGAMVVNIRGTSSISAGNDPLWVVDGIPIISNDLIDYGQNSIADINPSDIESIEVLKDASASTLYGSRASNGVILVTTKKGRFNEKTRVTLDSYVSVQDLWKKFDILGADALIAARNEAIDNYNTSYGLVEGNANYLSPVTAAYAGSDVNWMDEITRKALSTSHQLSISGGNQKTSFYLSGGIFYQEGVIKKTDYKRYNMRVNVIHNVNSRITVEAGTSFSASENDYTVRDGSIYSPWKNAMIISPDYPVYTNGDYTIVNANANPKEILDKDSFTTKKYRVMANAKGTWNILPELSYALSYGGDFNILHATSYVPYDSPEDGGAHGTATDDRFFTFTNLVENVLNYHKTFNKLAVGALLGYSYQYTSYDNNEAEGTNFLSPSLQYISSAGLTSSSSSFEENALSSFFSRVNLNYDEKYLLEASFRADGSSKFSPDNRWGYFPALSLGWRVTKESFFPEESILNDLKLRGSIGYTGNQEGIGNYEWRDVYSADGVAYNTNPGLGLMYDMPNEDLTWEKTLQYGLGLDYAFLDGRIEGSFDWFLKDTKDLLLNHSINATSGYSSITENVGNMRNTGFEFSVTSHNMTGKFKWDTTFGLTFSKNKVTGLVKNAEGEEADIETGYCNVLRIGEPLAAFFLLKADGIYQSEEEILAEKNGETLWANGIRPGDVKYYDLNDDGSIDSEDRVICGTPFPKFFGSLVNTFAYKGFDLTVDLQYGFGNKIYAGWKEDSDGLGNLGGSTAGNNILKSEWKDRWTASSPNNKTPRAVAYGSDGYAVTWNTQESSRYLQSGDFLRISNITLGYTIPRYLTERMSIERVRLYVTANNLYTFTGYEGMDPETVSFPSSGATYRGYDTGSVPALRSFVLGFNITF